MAVVQESRSLCDEISFPECGFHPDVVDLLERIDSDVLFHNHGYWGVGDGLTSSLGWGGGLPVESFDESEFTVSYRSKERGIGDMFREEGVTFECVIDDDISGGSWSKEVKNMLVGRDDTGEFFVMGRLVHPLNSSDMNKVVNHIESELSLVPERIRVVRRLEELYGEEVKQFGSEPRNPLSVSGVGAKSQERLIERFGVCSNVLFNSEEEIMKSLSTAYGNTPDLEQLISNVAEAVLLFKQEESEFTISIEDLIEFPYEPPVWLSGFSPAVHSAGEEYRVGNKE